jgi:hypothetical protein
MAKEELVRGEGTSRITWCLQFYPSLRIENQLATDVKFEVRVAFVYFSEL